jgi:ethanolamine utilization protein EutA
VSRSPTSTDAVTLIGLDFGSTTTSMLAATARIGTNCATGRMALSSPMVTFRPEPVFTPFDNNRLCLTSLRRQIQTWLDEARIDTPAVFAGGAIVTGLAAERDNANQLTELVEDMIGESVVATADDPRLESWLAFMGSCQSLARVMSDTPILNLDIGGGTTNPALGKNGNVTATGCYFVGARHVQFAPGTYRLTAVSRHGRSVLDRLAISADIGDELGAADAARMAGYYASALEAIVEGRGDFFAVGTDKELEKIAFTGASDETPVVTFSGGVGELVYAASAGQRLPSTTYYGDLGIDLAQAILASPILNRDLKRIVPENKGRATIQGLTLHSTEISGTTLFLPSPSSLPLRNLPVVKSLHASAGCEAIASALSLAGRSIRGACIQIEWTESIPSLDALRLFGQNLSEALSETNPLDGMPLVLLTTANVGKAIGNYATDWQQRHKNLIVIDEIPIRNAQFVNLGRIRQGIVPVSFYGMT